MLLEIAIALTVLPVTCYGSLLLSDTFCVSVIHLNDFHDRYEETSVTSGTCKNQNCVGGFSRIYAKISELVKERPNPVVLNAGDNFQGTTWYSSYKWNVTQHFFNLLPFDAYTLGNHEFDDEIDGLVPLLKALKAPTVVANIDDEDEPNIQGLYNKSTIIYRDKKKIGIVGVISKRTNELSRTQKLRFLDEVVSVNAESHRLVTEENVDTIIVLSHCGYEADKVIARNAAPKIGIIVGSHSHTFLYSGVTLPGPEVPEGPYPTVITHQDGRKILIVQASAYGKYLGKITVNYDKNGDVLGWSGAPIYLNSDVAQDVYVNQELEVWKQELVTQQKRLLGYSNVILQHDNCRYQECTLGNFLTDAMIDSFSNTKDETAWTYAAIAVTNSGGLRNSIYKGKISFGDASLSVPFRNTLEVIEISGKYLQEFLERAAGHHNNTSSFKINLMPVSGVHIVYNISKSIGSRVQSLKVRCRKCLIPRYEQIKENQFYRVVTNSFLAAGGDGHTILVNKARKLRSGPVDIDAVISYIQKQSPIIQEIQGRIKIVS